MANKKIHNIHSYFDNPKYCKFLDAANRKAIRSVIVVQRVQPSAVEIQSSTLQITNAITGGRPIVPLNTYVSESTNLTVTITRGGECQAITEIIV